MKLLHAPTSIALIAAAGASALAEPVELAPHVRIDRAQGFVEFDASVPIVADDEETVVYLELLVCIPDSKEHETLLVTPAQPSAIHAGLLALGLEPGAPGAFEWDGEDLIPIAPSGSAVIVEFIWTDENGAERIEPATSWVTHADTGERLPERPFIFSGSRFIDRGYGERYDADFTGTVVGLTTFGTETIAWDETISPEADIAEPVWIADPQRTPAFDTPVTVRIRPAD